MSGNIYFLTDGELIKVGYARIVSERIDAIQCGNGRKIECICAVPGTVKLERALHRELPDRAVGEWFKPSAKLIRLIRQIITTPVAHRSGCVPAFLAYESAKKARSQAVWERRYARLRARLKAETQALISELAERYGAKQLGQAIGFSEGAVRFWIAGHSMPNALAFARLGCYFPDRITDLQRPLGQPLIARAERLGIAA